MGSIGEQVVTVATAIVGVALLAVLVSKRSNTANVVSAAGAAFSKALTVAVSPVVGGFTGNAASTLSLPDLSYAFGNIQSNYPFN